MTTRFCPAPTRASKPTPRTTSPLARSTSCARAALSLARDELARIGRNAQARALAHHTAARRAVTGGAGFVGSHLREQLLRQGNDVIALDDFSTGSPDNVAHLLDFKTFRLVEHDVTQPYDFPVDQIFNLACPASPPHYQEVHHQALGAALALVVAGARPDRVDNAQRYTLNVTRADMAAAGHSPSVRLFEAAACGVPIISDWWAGLDEIFVVDGPRREIFVSRSPEESLAIVRELPEAERRAVAERARTLAPPPSTAAQVVRRGSVGVTG